MKKHEIIQLNEQEPRSYDHSPRVNLRMIQSLIDALKQLPPGVANSLSDSNIAADSGLVVLGAVGDPQIANRIRTEIGRELGRAGMRTSDDTVRIGGGAERYDDPYGGTQVEGYFDWSTMEVAFRSEYIQQILAGEALPEVSNTIVHEMLHRALYIVEQIPDFQSVIPEDLKTVWAGGWGDINLNRWPMVSDQNGAAWQINPGHAMIYSALNRPNSYYVDLFVRQFPLVNSIAANFFDSTYYAEKIILQDVDADPEQGFGKMYHYWRNLLFELDRNVAGFLQNLVRTPRPRARPSSMSRLSDGTRIGQMPVNDRTQRVRSLGARAQELLDSMNEAKEISHKYKSLLEMNLQSLFEQLSDQERAELEQLQNDIRLLLADPETRESLTANEIAQLEGTLARIDTALATEEEPIAPPVPAPEDTEDLDEPAVVEPEEPADAPQTDAPTIPPRSDNNNIVMQDNVSNTDVVLVYRVRENQLDLFLASGAYVGSFVDLGIVQNDSGEERIGGTFIRAGASRSESGSTELNDRNNVLQNNILEILRRENRFIDPETGELTPEPTGSDEPRVGDAATQEQSDRLRDINPRDYPMPGEELTQADVDRLTGASEPAPAPAEPAPAEPAPAEPAPPSTGPGNRLADQLAAIRTNSLLDDYNAGGRGNPNQNVMKLQQGLAQLGMNPGALDGKYGQNTYAAVQRFQQANGLTVDGEAGPNTLAAMADALRNITESLQLSRLLQLSGISCWK